MIKITLRTISRVGDSFDPVALNDDMPPMISKEDTIRFILQGARKAEP